MYLIGGPPDQPSKVTLAKDVPVTPLESYHPEQSTARWDPMGGNVYNAMQLLYSEHQCQLDGRIQAC